MGNDALPYKRVALPTADGFGELPCGHFSALLTVIVDESADFLLQLGYLGFVGSPDVEFYFDDVFVHNSLSIYRRKRCLRRNINGWCSLAEKAPNHACPIHNRFLVLVNPTERVGGSLLHLLQGGGLYGVVHREVGHILRHEVVQPFGLVDVAVRDEKTLHLQARLAGGVNRSNHLFLDFVLSVEKHTFYILWKMPSWGRLGVAYRPTKTLSGFSR